MINYKAFLYLKGREQPVVIMVQGSSKLHACEQIHNAITGKSCIAVHYDDGSTSVNAQEIQWFNVSDRNAPGTLS